MRPLLKPLLSPMTGGRTSRMNAKAAELGANCGEVAADADFTGGVIGLTTREPDIEFSSVVPPAPPSLPFSTSRGVVVPVLTPMWRVLQLLRIFAGTVTAALLASFALSVGAALPAAAIKVATQPVPHCRNTDLVIWLSSGGSSKSAGSSYDLVFTNLSGQSCALEGYPTVSAVNLSGHQLGKAASRRAGKALLVTLSTGASAIAVLQVAKTSARALASSACGDVPAAGLRVHLPDQTASAIVPYPFDACSYTRAAYLSITAIEKYV
jgi:hypothetical protein